MKSNKVVLETERLILREPCFSDWPSVQEYSSQSRVVRYVVWGPNTIPETKAFLRRCIRVNRKKPRVRYEWAVVEKATGQLVGMVGIGVLSTRVGEGGEMGYCLNPKIWGKGYATEAARAMIRFGFRKLGLRRIWSTCDSKNKASARVMEKAGMRREGHFRKNLFQKGKWRDTFLYAILRRNA